MGKMAKLYALLGVLLVICGAVFAVSRYQGKQEAIKKSGEVILEIPTDSVTSLSWTNESGTFSFTKGETWSYDDDAAFPVSEEKIGSLLSQFENFTAAFSIDDVQDYGQYGLDEPVCTIDFTADGETHTVRLGDFSKMDEQRYVSIGDGKVYLAVHDPLEEFDAVAKDTILDDTIPQFDTAEKIEFSGNENYTIVRDEACKSICESDVYFADEKPLDTNNVDTWLAAVTSLNLTDYVSYNVSEEELRAFALDAPALTVTLAYSGETGSGTLTLHLSQNPEELAAYNEAVQEEADALPKVTCYARVDQSQIVYEISQEDYDILTAVSYDKLRHRELFTADFDTAVSMDVALDGERFTFVYTLPEDEDAEGAWTYQEEEFDITALKKALLAVSASGFTEEKPTGQEEISLTVHLDNEDFPTFTLTLYRCDGTNCIASVDGKPTALVSRSQTVNLIEAVNALILGS